MISIFIIPFFKIGGAEKVHLEIVKSLAGKKMVFFTNIGEIEPDNPFLRFAKCYIFSERKMKWLLPVINALSAFKKIRLFGCNTVKFYALLPKVSAKIKKIDLTHSFVNNGRGAETFSLPYVHYVDERVVLNSKTKIDYINLYRKDNISEKYIDRIKIIPNGIEIKPFDNTLPLKRFQHFTVGYVGRNAPEKRPDLFLKIREKVPAAIHFKMLTDKNNPELNRSTSIEKILGVYDEAEVRKHFSEISLLIICSDFEGLPISMLEAMELGIPVISRNVGSIAEHINNNGALVNEGSDEQLVDQFADKILEFGTNREKYLQAAFSARKYAEENLDIQCFQQSWQNIFS